MVWGKIIFFPVLGPPLHHLNLENQVPTRDSIFYHFLHVTGQPHHFFPEAHPPRDFRNLLLILRRQASYSCCRVALGGRRGFECER